MTQFSIIFHAVLIPVAIVAGVANLYWFRRIMTQPISGLPWWVPLVGFVASLVSVSIGVYKIINYPTG